MKKTLPLVLLALLALAGYWFAQTVLRPMLATGGGDALALTLIGECRLEDEGCVLTADNLRMRLRTAGEISPLRRFGFVLDDAQGVESAEVSLEMVGMDMGVNRTRLKPVGVGRHEGSTILPACPAGRSDWVARLSIVSKGQRYEGEIPFVVVH